MFLDDSDSKARISVCGTDVTGKIMGGDEIVKSDFLCNPLSFERLRQRQYKPVMLLI